MKHIISMLVENRQGVLARIAGLFSGRGYNLESITVGATIDPTVSRLTLVCGGDDAIVEQIKKQLNRLIDVIKVYDLTDVPASSGFRFQADESANPVVAGTSPSRHFRLEVDDAGWWLVPGPQAAVYPVGYETTELKCGPAADAGCADVAQAPTSGYSTQDVGLAPQTSYVLRVRGDDGLTHYGVIRVVLLGFDQNDRALMIFDWAYQVQANNPALIVSR